MAGTNESGELKSLEEQFDWQLDHSVSPPRWIGGIAGLNSSGSYITVTSTTDGSKERLDVATTTEITTDMEGGKVTVGTSEVAITFTETPTGSPTITSHPDNSGLILLGKTGVTSAGVNSLGCLIPGGTVRFDGYADATNAIYVISDTAAQTVFKGLLL